MGDEQVGEAQALLQVLQKVYHLRLDRDVERRDRLVADDQLGLDRERAGDADALSLAARELVRVAALVPGREADLLEQLAHPRLLLGALGEVMDLQGLADDLADRHARIQRSVGILEDDLHLAAEPPELGLVEVEHVLAVEAHRASGRLDQAQQHAARGRLAASGLADQRQGLAGLDGERHAVDGAHRSQALAQHQPASDREILDQVLDLEERHLTRLPTAAAPASRRSCGRG